MGNHASSPSARRSPVRRTASNATIAHTPMAWDWTAGDGSDAPTRQAMSSSFQRFPIRARQLGVDAAAGERRKRVVVITQQRCASHGPPGVASGRCVPETRGCLHETVDCRTQERVSAWLDWLDAMEMDERAHKPASVVNFGIPQLDSARYLQPTASRGQAGARCI
jgi:hypothetical protein